MNTDRAEGAEDTNTEATRSASPQQEKHTPGPWKWAYDKSDPTEGHSVVLLGGHKGPGIASHRTWTCDHCLYPEDGAQFKEAEANARLIAAAPDLLTAAKSALEWCEQGGPCDWKLIATFRDELRAAIAKAAVR